MVIWKIEINGVRRLMYGETGKMMICNRIGTANGWQDHFEVILNNECHGKIDCMGGGREKDIDGRWKVKHVSYLARRVMYQS